MNNFDHFRYVQYGLKKPNIQGYYTFDEQGKDQWTWKEVFATLPQFEEFKRIAEERGHGIYRSVPQFATPNRSALALRNLDYDFDKPIPTDTPPEQEEAAKLVCLAQAKEQAFECLTYLSEIYHIDPASIQIFFSGGKGFGARIPYQLFLKSVPPYLNEIFSTFAAPLKARFDTLDMSMYTPVRLWGVANTRYKGSDTYRIELILDELYTLSIEEITALATKPRYVYNPPKLKLNFELWKAMEKANRNLLKELALYQKLDRQEAEETQKKEQRLASRGITTEYPPPPEDPYKILDILGHNRKYADIVGGVTPGYEPQGSTTLKGRNGCLIMLMGACKKWGVSLSTRREVAMIFNDRCNPSKKPKEIEDVYDFYK